MDARTNVAQAISDKAKAFCGRFGFRPSPDREPSMLLLHIFKLGVIL